MVRGIEITLVSVGRDKEEFIRLGIEKYSRQLKRYATLHRIFIKEAGGSFPTGERIKKETENVRKFLKQRALSNFILLADTGRISNSSGEFAKYLESYTQKKKNIIFITGGPFGLSREFVNSAENRIALSRLTLNHQLVRLVLLEQIYRAFTIIEGSKYHH
jgi:23S rRNA (pseudouridine1915-N3)-methyltransferase